MPPSPAHSLDPSLPGPARTEDEALRERLAKAVEHVAEAVFVADQEGRLSYRNPAFETTFGHRGPGVLGRPMAEILPGLPLPDLAKGEPWQGRAWCRDSQGHPVHLDGSVTPIRDARGVAASCVGVLRDVTREVEAERQLRHMQKMDALGVLASGVAHDFNNILTAILSAAELIEWQVPADSPIRPNLQVIAQAVLRARELNRHILSITRSTEEKQVPFDLSSVVKEAVYLLRSTFPASVAIHPEVSSGLWILGDPQQAHQVVINLAVNALQAMLPQAGDLRITLGEEQVEDAPGPRRLPGLSPGRYAILTVEDTGRGMEPAVQERIFEPYFTTRGDHGASGLGLSVVHGIVRKHGGVIEVRSEAGKGSRFALHFPCTAASRPVLEDKSTEDLAGNERILLVDDEEVVGALGKQGLQMLGYRVTSRSNSREALEDIQNHPMDFDLVVTDLSMPGIPGVELIQRIRKVRPDMPAILITGAFQAPTMQGIHTPFEEVLFKPVSIQSMARSIRKVMALRPMLEAAEDSQPSPREAADLDGSPSILLAEDSSVTRSLLRSWLAKAGYQVQVARDGQEAWEAFQRARDRGGFSLVLTDIEMPSMDGLELSARIREADKHVPIVILSTSEDADAVKKALHLQVNEFLTKPFESSVLLSCVERMKAQRASRLKVLRSAETAQAVRMARRALEAAPEKGLPIYSISVPLTDAGGDVFRCHRGADGSIFFAIADVAGHSVISSYAVAAYLGMLSNFLGECIPLRQGKDEQWPGPDGCNRFGSVPCAPLRHLATRLNRNLQTGPFSEVPICSLFGLWTPRTGRLHVLNAGIPHALWYRHGLGRTDTIGINGAPLGILDDPPMEEKVIAMEPGDRLLLGTDGFFDALSPEGTAFEGIAGSIWRDLACADVVNALNLVSESARAHSAGRFTDDMLVVALEQGPMPHDPAQFTTSFLSSPEGIDRTCESLAAFMEAHQPALGGGPSWRFNTLLAVREALSNALLHGNPAGRESRIGLTAHWDCLGKLQVRVVDEGTGFDLEAHRPPEEVDSERGRGIPMIRHFAQEVTMTGGELLMTFEAEVPDDRTPR